MKQLAPSFIRLDAAHPRKLSTRSPGPALAELAIALVALLYSPGRAAADPATKTHSLAPGRLQQPTLGAGERHAWRVAVGAGQRAVVEVVAGEPGLHVQLFDEAGRQVLAHDQVGPETIAWTSASGGRWTIELTPLALSSPDTSDYGIWLPVLRNATARDRAEWERDLLATGVRGSLEEGKLKEATEALPRLLAAAQTAADDPVALASDLESLSEYFAIFCDGSTAADLLGRALALRESAQGADHLDVASTLNQLATVRFYLGQWDLGEEAERRALDIRLQHLAKRPQAESYRDLGSLYYYEGKFAEAVEFLKEALKLFSQEKPPSRADIAEVRGILAEVYLARGARKEGARADYPEAQAALNTAADEARNVQKEAPEVYAYVLNYQAKLKHYQGRDAEAKSDLRQAFQIFSGIEGYPRELAMVTMNLADIDRAQKDYAAAEEGFRKALELAEQAFCPGHPDLLWYLNQSALSLAEWDRHEEAEPLYQRGLKIAKEALGPNHPTVARSLHDLAETLGALGRHEEADTISRQALAIREKVFGADHPETAVSIVQRARLVFQRTGEASDKVLDSVRSAIGILERTRIYPESAIEAYALQADLLRRRGDAAGARQALARALDLVDAQRTLAGGGDQTRASFLRSYVGYFLRMVDWQIEAENGEDNVEAALETSERYRARVLQDQLAASGMDLLGGGGTRLDALEERRVEARARIAELRKGLEFTRSRSDIEENEKGQGRSRRERVLAYEARLEAAYRDHEAVIEELKSESQRWRSVDGRTARFAEIRDAAPEGGFLLLYQIGEERSHVFLVPPAPERPKAYPLEIPADAEILGVPRGPLTAAMTSQLFPIGSSSPEEASQRLHALWRLLVPPAFWERLEGATEVVVVPDRWLHSLPFEQLVVDPGDRPGAERYWLDAGPPIRYAPSASSLHALRRRGEIGNDAVTPPVLTVADPIYDPADTESPSAGTVPRAAVLPRPAKERPLDRLIGTADETRAILEVFREVYGDAGVEVLALAREQATESRVRAALQGKRFIHLGTHGIVEDGRELFAGLALAPPASESWPAEDDGFLHLFEIYDLPVSADLVVLSACDTQVGRAIEGEGVFALSRGFLAAGARRVVASLWKVEQGSTAVLMESFFRRVLGAYREGQPLRYSEALRDAKREVRNRPGWSSPFYWAPFVLTGIE